MGNEIYTPRPKTAAILKRAMEHVRSVPYRVGLRWVFYRLLQDGYYATKADYKNKLTPALSAARHAGWGGWEPETLVDESRQAIEYEPGYATTLDWMAAIVKNGIACPLDYWYEQPYYVEIWYEARAMTEQFQHYTDHITLRPMGGFASIPYKKKAAMALDAAAAKYCKPIVVLYFGDLDTAGQSISDVSERDVRKWCKTPFRLVRCGLTIEQAIRYNMPENFEKPGDYQWEALTDQAAGEIITESIEPFISHDGFAKVDARANHAEEWLRLKLKNIAQDFVG